MSDAGIGAGDAMYWASRAYNAEADRDALRAENERLRALLREAQDRSVYIAAPATDDHSISLRERIDAALAREKPC